MTTDDLKIAPSREEVSARRTQAKSRPAARRPQPTYAPPPPPPAEKAVSPWVPFAVSVVLLISGLGGLFYYTDLELKKIHGSQLKTNDYVMGLNKRLTHLEDKISQTDADLSQSGSSITGKLINFESRLNQAEKSVAKNVKSVGWNSSRIGKQVTTLETMEADVDDMNVSVSTQQKTVSSNTIQIQALSEKLGASGNINAKVTDIGKRVDSNSQSIDTIDAHRSRLGSAIQKVQGDTARLIRLYEKDNPSAKRVH